MLEALQGSCGQSTGKPNQIISTSEKGRLSRAEIDCMLRKAEKFCAESESNKAKLEAKNGLGIISIMHDTGNEEC